MDTITFCINARKNKKKQQKKTIPFSSNLHFFKELTLSKHIISQGTDTGLNRAATGLEDTVQLL